MGSHALRSWRSVDFIILNLGSCIDYWSPNSPLSNSPLVVGSRIGQSSHVTINSWCYKIVYDSSLSEIVASGILNFLQDLVASSNRVSRACNIVAWRSVCSRHSFCVVSVITTLMSRVICLRHSNVHFPQKNILLASCSRKHTKQHSVALLGQYSPWAKSALNSSHLSACLNGFPHSNIY